ncbi:MAG: signal peptidase I [Candidatus Sericytochromatia bacterium]|nr:signal peptidase I [Candidatus Sericytochromatia bacterium]
MPSRPVLSARELMAFGAGGLSTLALLSAGPLHARLVPSSSMAPTLQPGDRLAVIATGPSQRPTRGQIVVFKAPFRALPGETAPWIWGLLAGPPLFVKRIIGLPGDTVVVVPARGVLVNGRPLAEPYVAEPARYAWGPARVPAGRVCVLGDNRNDSFDSHHWGLLPIDAIVGRPAAVFWPPSRTRIF